MSDLKKDFEEAMAAVKLLPSQPNDVLLKLYALYKQSSSGDANGKRPGLFDLRGRAKFDAWAKLKNTSEEKAMMAYVDTVRKLVKKNT